MKKTNVNSESELKNIKVLVLVLIGLIILLTVALVVVYNILDFKDARLEQLIIHQQD